MIKPFSLLIVRAFLLLVLTVPLQGCMEVAVGTMMTVPMVKSWRDQPSPVGPGTAGLRNIVWVDPFTIAIKRNGARTMVFKRAVVVNEGNEELELMPASVPKLTRDDLSIKFHQLEKFGASFEVQVFVLEDGVERHYTCRYESKFHWKITNGWTEFIHAVDP